MADTFDERAAEIVRLAERWIVKGRLPWTVIIRQACDPLGGWKYAKQRGHFSSVLVDQHGTEMRLKGNGKSAVLRTWGLWYVTRHGKYHGADPDTTCGVAPKLTRAIRRALLSREVRQWAGEMPDADVDAVLQMEEELLDLREEKEV